MELVNETQRPPLILVFIMTALIIAGAYLTTRIVDPAPALANKFYWYMARSAGFTAYGLLSITVLLGVSTTSSIWDKLRLRRFVTQMHQFASLLILPFLFFHLWGLHQDTSIPFSWATILVPFTDQYRPLFTGFGILTLYGLVLIVVTSYFREKISVKAWRQVHYASFPMFILVTMHGILTGTDSTSEWAILIYLIPTTLFILLVLKRIRKSKQKPQAR